MQIGTISIARRIDAPSDIPFDVLYEAVGKNTGNFMFTESIFRQADAKVSQIGFNFDPAGVNAEFDLVAVPAANWLNKNANWDWLCDLLEQIEIPVVTIGLGAQAETRNLSQVELSPSSIRLAKLLSRKGNFISTRGTFTTSVLNSLGLMNAVTTGCPSLYLRQAVAHPGPIAGIDDAHGEIVLQSTRYGFSSAFLESDSVNRLIFKLAGRYNLPMIYQSEPEEIEYLLYGDAARAIFSDRLKSMCALYGFEDREQMLTYLRERTKVFFTLSDWSEYISKAKLLIGTRLHGSIMALNCGVPALLVAHDSRTSELIDFARIPSIGKDTLAEGVNIDKLRQLPLREWLDDYSQTRASNGKIFRAFLAENNIPVNEEAFIDRA